MIIHQQMPIVQRGASLDEAQAAMLLVHGRGSNPDGILMLTSHFSDPRYAFLAPTAKGNTWYPQRFLMPRQSNEPQLTSALETIDGVMSRLVDANIPPEKTMLLGFSQGACLVLEYAMRYPKRYGGVVGLSGALIGADDELVGYDGNLADTPIFLGCSDIDDHIPLERVKLATKILSEHGGQVTERIYPNFGHTVNMDEISVIQQMMSQIIA